MDNTQKVSPLLKSFVYLIVGINVTIGTVYQLTKLLGAVSADNFASYLVSAIVYPFHFVFIGSYLLGRIHLKTLGTIYIEMVCVIAVMKAYSGEENFKPLRLMIYIYFAYTENNLTESAKMKIWHSVKPIFVITALEIASGHLVIGGLKEVIIVLLYLLVTIFSILTLLDSEARKSELMRTLEETKQQLSAVLSAIPVGIFVLTSQEEVFNSNSACFSLLGCSSADQIRETVGSMIYKEGMRQYEGEAQTLLQDIRHYIARPDDASVTFGQTHISERTLQWIGQKTIWNSQPAAIVVITDLTGAIMLERAKNESAFKNVMLRSVSHELKTPTNAIIHAVNTVLNQYDLPPNAKYKLQIAEVSSKNLLMLIRDLLDFSSIIAGRFSLSFSRFDIRQCLSDCVDLISLAAAKNQLRIVKHFDPLLPETVYTDHNRLSQVVLNLLSNAAKFTLQGGRIDVTAMLNDFGQMELSVTDTGIGISPENLSTLFDSFNRIENSASINTQGTGLGLNISNMLAKELGGSPIQVESRINRGSCFKFNVGIGNPYILTTQVYSDSEYESEPHDSAQSIYTFDVVSRRFPPVLVVDDTPFNRLIIIDILAASNIECCEAVTGEQAIEIVIERAMQSHPIQVIVMDYEMPGINGPTASKLILQRLTELMLPRPRIIAHSAYSSETDIQVCREAGMIDYMPKPSSNDFITSMIKRHLSI